MINATPITSYFKVVHDPYPKTDRGRLGILKNEERMYAMTSTPSEDGLVSGYYIGPSTERSDDQINEAMELERYG